VLQNTDEVSSMFMVLKQLLFDSNAIDGLALLYAQLSR